MHKRLLLFFLLFLAASGAQAHDSRPNFVEIIETETGVFTVHWKIPASVPFQALPTIRMPESCNTDARLATQQAGGAYQGRQDYVCPGGRALSQHFKWMRSEIRHGYLITFSHLHCECRVLCP